MLNQLVLVLSALSFAACDREVCSAPGTSDRQSIAELTPGQLAALTRSGPITIVDANPRSVFDGGHVPGATWMATDDLTAILPEDRASRVVFYCYSEACGASHAAAKAAVMAGWTNVARMPAGISGWRAAGLPVEK